MEEGMDVVDCASEPSTEGPGNIASLAGVTMLDGSRRSLLAGGEDFSEPLEGVRPRENAPGEVLRKGEHTHISEWTHK